jgi:hypothetical protein
MITIASYTIGICIASSRIIGSPNLVYCEWYAKDAQVELCVSPDYYYGRTLSPRS